MIFARSLMEDRHVVLKSRQEIVEMKAANRIVAEILDAIKGIVRPGITTEELNGFAEEKLREKKAKPAFKGYRGYPKALCTSVNSQVVHGIPSRTPLKDGDLLSIDFGAYYKGFYGDAAITIPVGNVSDEALRLKNIAEEALYAGIKKAYPGNRLSDISFAIQSLVEKNGFSVVREFVGHGIGRSLHEEPQVPNFGCPGLGVRLKAGMVLAIEPMINAGGSEVKILQDGWTAVTKDGSLSAHFEHTVAITEDGPVILTRLDG
ncbi:MAG: type I methionyl aminopeptidase [Deltaproteobacteria bacterium]|nr:type I methionyl aminopeptidase [Deltaproteobacteria bacterium]